MAYTYCLIRFPQAQGAYAKGLIRMGPYTHEIARCDFMFTYLIYLIPGYLIIKKVLKINLHLNSNES